jgi:S1-C subfamily serine protease
VSSDLRSDARHLQRRPLWLRGDRVLTIAAIVGLTVTAPGCGGDGSDKTRTVERERTKVQVVEGSSPKSGFDAAAIFGRASNGVVTITSLFGEADNVDSLLGGGGAGQGSGFVVDEEGRIATNAHVLTQGAGKKIKKAREVFVQFADGNQVSAEIVGFDPNSDVGLIKVDPKGLDLVPLKLGRSADARVGEPVAAIGSPFGEEQSLSVGVVSATDRTIEALTDFQIGDAIQTDAAVNRGNSGGPLLDAGGEVIGINSQIKSSGGGSEGVGFAVPVDTVKRSLDQLRAHRTVRYGYLGVSSQALYPQLADRLKLRVDEGALVAEAVKDGPAQRAGIKGGGKEIRFQATLVKPGGDVITKVNGSKVGRKHDLGALITRYRPGETVTLELLRDGEKRQLRVKLGERPTDLPG